MDSGQNGIVPELLGEAAVGHHSLRCVCECSPHAFTLAQHPVSIWDCILSFNIHFKQNITQVLPEIHAVSVCSQCACKCFCGVEFGEVETDLSHDAGECVDDVTFLVDKLNPKD